MVETHKKFIFDDFPKSMVVNVKDKYEEDYQKEEVINQAVTQHLSSIVSDQEITEKNTEESKPLLSDFNIDQIKLENYNRGLDDAKVKYEEIIANLHRDNDFSDLIHDKLSEICSENRLDGEVAELSTQIIEMIAKKIYLILPIDFEAVLRNELIEKLKKYYKEGEINLTINPARSDICNNILKSEKLGNKFKDKINIITDEKVDVDDCKLQWQDTTLEYNKEQLNIEIDKILEQLKNSK